MSDEGDTFWVSLFERVIGLFLIIIGALLLYFSATTELGGFGLFFGAISIVLVILGILLFLIKPPK